MRSFWNIMEIQVRAEYQQCIVTRCKTWKREELMGLTEGPWDEVMKIIGQAHSYLHEKGIVRIQTDVRVGSRSVIRDPK